MGSPGAGRRLGHLTLAPAAALAGAAGLGLEVLLIESSGLALGYGRSGPVGLATFLAAWALGAWWAGRGSGAPRAALIRIGAAACVLAGLAEGGLLAVASRLPGSPLAGLVAVLAIGSVALVQGAFLPWLLRASAAPPSSAGATRGRSGVGWLFAANLTGAVLGAALGHAAARHVGRIPAAWSFGALALAAGTWGALFARGASGTPEPEAALAPSAAERSRARAACLAIGLGTAWLVTLEWVGLRLGTLWIGGMQASLTALLAATMIALAVGAACLPALLPRGSAGLVAWLVVAALASLWPLAVSGYLAAAPDAGGLVEALLGADVPDLARASVLIGPALLPFGALVPVAYRAAGAGPRTLGDLLLHEAWGALLGVPVAHALVVPRFGLAGAIAFGLVLASGLALIVGGRHRIVLAVAFGLLALWAGGRPAPALVSPPLANPALTVLAFAEDEHFAVSVVEDGLLGERTLMTDGFRAAGTGEDYLYMRALGSLPLLLHPAPRSVCVLALGTGTTLGQVATHAEVERIEVLELSRAVLDQAPWFEAVHRGALEDPRVTVALGDGRRTLAARRAAYDVLTLEPLLPDSPFAVYLYTEEFYAAARRALRPGGLVCQWVPPHALEPVAFRAVLDAFARSFAWSGVWVFGTQAILIGGEAEPALDGARLPQPDGAAWTLLRELGLESAAGILARCVTRGDALPAAERRLTDADPWIVYRPRRSGAVLLADLPENLGFLREAAVDPPRAWLDAGGERARAALAALRALRAAREVQAADEAALRGVVVRGARPTLPLDELRHAARSWRADEPEVVRFERDLLFLARLRRGVSALAATPGRAGAEAALEDLVTAAELRGERADVHVYLGVALDRLGVATAGAALDAARERCPGVARTPVGRRARERLGLSDPGWQRLGGSLGTPGASAAPGEAAAPGSPASPISHER